MASKKEDKDVSLRNIRIDDLKNTVADYTDKLAQMARQLEERQARKALLQKTFEKKQQRCEALRAEVQALRTVLLFITALLLSPHFSCQWFSMPYLSCPLSTKPLFLLLLLLFLIFFFRRVECPAGKKREVKEQEKLRLTRIDQANRDLKAAKAKLTAMRSEKEEVKQRISEKVSEFEARCLSLASKFQNLELVNQDGCGENAREEITEAHLAVLQQKLGLLEQAKGFLSPQTEALKTVLREGAADFDKLQEINKYLEKKEASLKMFQILREKKNV